MTTSFPNPSPDPFDTHSAEGVVPNVYVLPPDLDNKAEAATIKCTVCTSVTPHRWFKISPAPVGAVDPMHLLKLTKRLTMCTVCGTLKLIN